MANPFAKLKAPSDIKESGDTLGGGVILDTDAYDATIKLAFVQKSASSDSMSVVIHLDINGQEYRESLWVTGKDGNNYYEKDGKKSFLQGYTNANDIALMTTGMPLNELESEEKTVKLWDADAKKELPKSVQVFTQMLDQPVTVAIQRETVDKTAKDNAGVYQPTGETRDQNVIVKVFHTESRRTKTEILEEIEEGIFIDKWIEKNKGKTSNRVKGGEGKTGTPGSSNAGAAPTSGTAKPKTSLFGTKK